MNKKFFKNVHDALVRGESAAIVMIASAAASSPAKSGACMAVFEDGSTDGTIGGGALERMATDEAARFKELQRIQHLDLSAIGMACGGEATLVYRRLNAGDIGTVASLADGVSNVLLIFDPCESTLRTEPMQGDDEALTFDADRLALPVARPERALIFGAGHIARSLAPILMSIDFHVVVFDDREAFVSHELICADEIFLVDYSHMDFSNISSKDYAVVLTHGHLCDTVVTAGLLTTDARYIGCVGSAKKVATMKAELSSTYGLCEGDLNRLHSPIGLKIRAKTPPEIAVSIAAEMILTRRTYADTYR